MGIFRQPSILSARNAFVSALANPSIARDVLMNNIRFAIYAYCSFNAVERAKMTAYDEEGQAFLITYATDALDAHTYFTFNESNSTFYILKVQLCGS